jgi:hypothetical protein
MNEESKREKYYIFAVSPYNLIISATRIKYILWLDASSTGAQPPHRAWVKSLTGEVRSGAFYRAKSQNDIPYSGKCLY